MENMRWEDGVDNKIMWTNNHQRRNLGKKGRKEKSWWNEEPSTYKQQPEERKLSKVSGCVGTRSLDSG